MGVEGTRIGRRRAGLVDGRLAARGWSTGKGRRHKMLGVVSSLDPTVVDVGGGDEGRGGVPLHPGGAHDGSGPRLWLGRLRIGSSWRWLVVRLALVASGTEESTQRWLIVVVDASVDRSGPGVNGFGGARRFPTSRTTTKVAVVPRKCEAGSAGHCGRPAACGCGGTRHRRWVQAGGREAGCARRGS